MSGMVLRNQRAWTRYVRKSYRGNLRRHPVPENDNWRRMERYYTTVSPIMAATAVREAWRNYRFDAVDPALRPVVNRLLQTIISRTLFSNMTDLPERSTYRDAKLSQKKAAEFMPQIENERAKIIELLGTARAKLLFKELSQLIRLMEGAHHL